MILLLYVSDIIYFRPEQYNSGLLLPLGIFLLFGMSLLIARHQRIYKKTCKQ